MGKHKTKRRNEDEELYALFKKFKKRMRRERHSSTSSEIEVVQDDIQAPESVEEFQEETNLAKQATVELAPENQLPELPATETLQENPSESLPLDEDILNILGEDPNKKTYAEPIHKDITMRWNHIITNGLEKDSKTELLKLYPIPDNCLFLEAPKINPEIKAAVSEQVLKRDRAMEQQQNCLGQATACIGKALDILIKNKECKEATKIVSDTGRMLCDLFHTESISRRYLLQFALNKDTKDIVTQTKVSKYIFGENLYEDLKAGKAINKTGSEIKYNQPQSSKQAKPTNLNSRGPPRKYQPQHTPSAGRQLNPRPRPAAQRWPAPQRWQAPQRWPAPQQRSGPPNRKT